MKEIAEQWEAVKEIEKSLRHAGGGEMDLPPTGEPGDEKEHAWTRYGKKTYGDMVPKETPVTRFFRDAYKKQDADWGGLMGDWDRDASQSLWKHPLRPDAESA